MGVVIGQKPMLGFQEFLTSFGYESPKIALHLSSARFLESAVKY